MNLDSLKTFSSRLERLTKTDIRKNVTNEMAAETELQVHLRYPDVTVVHHSTSNGAMLDITGNGLWFREFGTGYIGDGTYPDSTMLPTITLSFTSGRDGTVKNYTTNGWQYHYHPLTDQVGYWYTPTGGKTYGQVAQAGIYETCKWLERNQLAITRNALEGVDNP